MICRRSIIGFVGGVALFFCAGLAGEARANPTYKGMSYTSFGPEALSSTASDQSLYDLSVVGANTVALNVWWFQQTPSSTTIAEDDTRYSSTMSSIQHAVDTIHSLGMNVLLKPMLDVDDGTWRAQITPSNVNAWFSSYTSFMNTFADFAEQNRSKGVSMLSVGCEMNSMEQYTSQWNTLIDGVRSRYGGQLTYAANWGSTSVGANNNVGGYQTVPWWNKLDAIGIDAYFPISNTNNPTESQLQSSWNGLANTIENWRNTRGLTQKVIFTEVGYQSADGASQTPWGVNGSPAVDQQEQADSYQALLTTMSSRPWYDGQFWWSWNTTPLGGYSEPTGFTVQQKLAESVLASAYGGKVPTIRVPAKTIASFESGSQGFAYSGFGISGTTVNTASKDATNGLKSLAITTPQPGFNWAATVGLHSGDAGFDNFVMAAYAPQDYVMKFDVTYDPTSLPAGSISLFMALNSDGGWSQQDNLASSSTTSLKTIHVELPMTLFTLSKTSTWYEFVLGLSGNWGSNLAGTIFIDNWQIANIHYVLGDFNGDYQVTNADLQAMLGAMKDLNSYQLSQGLTATALKAIADVNGDGLINAADIQAEMRLLATGSAGGGSITPVPEPASIVLLGLMSCLLVGHKLLPR